MTGHFRKKSLFFRDTRDNQEYDAKNRLSIPSPSPEKLVAEIARLKKTDLREFRTKNTNFGIQNSQKTANIRI